MRRCGRRTPQTASTGRPRRRRRSSGRARVRPRRRRCCRAPGRMLAKRLRRCLARAADAPPLAHPAESNRRSRGGRYPAQAAGRGGKGGAAAAQGGLWRGQQRGALRCWCATGVAQGPVGPRRGGQREQGKGPPLERGSSRSSSLKPIRTTDTSRGSGGALLASRRPSSRPARPPAPPRWPVFPPGHPPHPSARCSRCSGARAGSTGGQTARSPLPFRLQKGGGGLLPPVGCSVLLFCARPARTSDSTCMVHPWRRDHHASSGQEEHKSSMTAAHC